MAVQPPPVNDTSTDSVAWKDWYFKFARDANLQNHNDLNNIQGGNTTQRYHLEELEWEQSISWRRTSRDVPITFDPNNTGDKFILSNSNKSISLVPAIDGPDTNVIQSAMFNTPVPSTGKYYWEICYQKILTTGPDQGTTYAWFPGFADATFNSQTQVLGLTSHTGESWGHRTFSNGGSLYINGTVICLTTGVTSAHGDTCTSTSIFQYALDVDGGLIYPGAGNTYAGDPVAGTNAPNSGSCSPGPQTLYSGPTKPGVGVLTRGILGQENRIWTMRTQLSEFSFTPPAGYDVLPPDSIIRDDNFLIPATGGDIYTLPTGTSWNGRILCIKKTDDTGTVTINAATGNTIDGAASITLTGPKQGIILQLYNVTWLIISEYIDSDVTFADTTNFSKRYSLLVS